MEGILSVSALTARIKGCLEGAFRSVRVEGEVSNFRLYPSGHRYFSLKDEGAQIRVVLFRGRERFLFGEMKDGRAVVVSGSLGVYEKKGEYQILAHSVEVRGYGALLVELEKRKARLAALGLFDASRKRPIPAFPARVGIVTSRQGAALRDMIRIARGRWPCVGIILAPALVQGEGAAADIVDAIGRLVAAGAPDVVIVGRGGGSAEDLLAFNEEAVVRAVAACPVPTISAVGHETDVTLCDLAADLRAPTPTAAAQMAVPDRDEMRIRVRALSDRAGKADRFVRETARREWRIAATALADPRPLVASKRYAAAAQADALAEAVPALVRRAREKVETLSASVRAHSPAAWVARRRGDTAALAGRLSHRMESARDARRGALGVLRGKLSVLDPLAVLGRGYAIATHRATGRAIRSASEVHAGLALDVRVGDGVFGAVAEERDG